METVRSGTVWFTVDNVSVAGSARRRTCELAERLGFDESRVGDVGIVVSEIVANLWKHATDATFGVQVALRDGIAGVQLIALDHGPGMSDVHLSAIDGHSTSGTLGLGLGAMIRLASTVDISSVPSRGTVLTAVLWPESPNSGAATFAEDGTDVVGLTRPIAGEEVCGDAVGARRAGGYHLLVLSDGLGHGPIAAGASSEALAAFHAVSSTDPKVILTAIHANLLGTRGAAVAVGVIDPQFRSMDFAGIGNVSAFVDDGTRRGAALSQPGIVGHQRPTLIRVQTLPLAERAVVILHSDGVRENWDLRRTPGLSRRSSAVIAGSVLRDAGTRPDDASVLVARRWS